MTDLREQPRPVTVEPETTAEDIAETLALLNAEAKRMSRCGKTGTLTADYATWHARIDSVLLDWQRVSSSHK